MEKKSEPFQVCVCGGGNTAHFSAAVIGSNPQFRVNIFTRKPSQWSKELIAHTNESPWRYKGDIVGKLNVVSDNPKEVAKGTKFFIICGPVYAQQPVLEKIAPYVEKDSYIGTIFGQGGFDWLASYVFGKKIKNDNLTIFALQNVPSLCKIKTYGQAVRIIGPKLILPIVCMQAEKKEALCDLIQDLYTIPATALPNFLCATLTPSNQIIHPARTYGVFKDWDGKTPYDEKKLPLLYEDMDDYSAEWMIKLDNEIQAIKSAILKKYPNFDLSSVFPMQKRIIKQYGDQIKDKSTMRTVFSTNAGYATLKFPLKPVEGGVVLDLNSRFFWEDVPFGLVILKDISNMLGLKCPAIDFLIEWHQKFMGKKYIENGKLVKETLKETGAPSRYGIKNIDQLLKLSNMKPKL